MFIPLWNVSYTYASSHSQKNKPARRAMNCMGNWHKSSGVQQLRISSANYCKSAPAKRKKQADALKQDDNDEAKLDGLIVDNVQQQNE